MSSSHETQPPQSIDDAPTAFPILMRLPDLRTIHEPPAPEVVAPPPLAATAARIEEPESAASVACVTTPPTECEAAAGPSPVEPSPEKKIVAPTVELPPPEPLAPAAQRRQRALERQRRVETDSTPRSWRTSHAPVIAIGFLVALTLTVVIARRNRAEPSPVEQARLEPEIQELNIDMGTPSATPPSIDTPSMASSSLSAPPTLEISAEQQPLAATLDSPPPPKLPLLLPSSPSQTEADTLSTSAPKTDERVAARETIAAKAVVDASTDSSPDFRAANETLPASATSETSEFGDANSAYPSTDSARFPPNGLPLETARPASDTPIYPSTSSPNAWR